MITPVAGNELFKTISKYTNQKTLIVEKLKEFILYKVEYPANGAVPGQYPGYGNVDKKFKPNGNFGKEIKGVAHAHLTHNISIVYLIEGDKLNLYGVYTHDDIGTGQPPNMRRQQQMALKWANMTFDQVVDVNKLVEPEKIDDPEEVKPATPKVDYTAKSKKTAVDKTAELIKQVDALWPQRGLSNKLSNARSKEEIFKVINQEALFVDGIRQKGQKINPNVMDYFKGLEALFSRYNK